MSVLSWWPMGVRNADDAPIATATKKGSERTESAAAEEFK
jgi:hypothetical protein